MPGLELTKDDLNAMIKDAVSAALPSSVEVPPSEKEKEKQNAEGGMSADEIKDLVKSAVVEVIGENHRASGRKDLAPEVEKDLSSFNREERGKAFARMTRAMAHAKIKETTPEKVLAHWGDGENSPATKILVLGTPASGGYLNPEIISDDFIELLREYTVIRQAGGIEVPMPMGNLTINGMAGGATANYVAELGPAVESTLTFRQVKLAAKKMMVFVPISYEIAEMSHPKADQIVMNDMLSTAALREDLAFLRDDGSSNNPKGLRNITGIATVASAGTTLANIRRDLAKGILSLRSNHIPMKNVVRFISPRSEYTLLQMADGNGNLVWANEMAKGKLGGKPFYVTSNIPENLGTGTDESEVYTVDMSQVVIGDGLGPEIKISTEASYTDHESTPVTRSAFQNDMVLLRLRLLHDINVRHTKAVHVVTGVQWDVA
jgi:HK97 family phage major capsid protein